MVSQSLAFLEGGCLRRVHEHGQHHGDHGRGYLPQYLMTRVSDGRPGSIGACQPKEALVATRDMTEATVGQRAERTGVKLTGRRDETKWAPLTTEFWAMIGVIVATLIAAAVADNFDAPRAWLIVGFVGAAYIVSRGLAKSGTTHRDDETTRRDY